MDTRKALKNVPFCDLFECLKNSIEWNFESKMSIWLFIFSGFIIEKYQRNNILSKGIMSTDTLTNVTKWIEKILLDFVVTSNNFIGGKLNTKYDWKKWMNFPNISHDFRKFRMVNLHTRQNTYVRCNSLLGFA